MRRNAGRTIQLYIDRLILDGLPVDQLQAPHLQAAVETELSRLLVENGIATDLQVGGAVPNVNANAIQLRADKNPVTIGTQIAQSVYGRIGNKQ